MSRHVGRYCSTVHYCNNLLERPDFWQENNGRSTITSSLLMLWLPALEPYFPAGQTAACSRPPKVFLSVGGRLSGWRAGLRRRMLYTVMTVYFDFDGTEADKQRRNVDGKVFAC